MKTSLDKVLSSIRSGEGLRGQLLRSGIGVGGLKVLSLPLTLLVTVLLARSLGPEGFGQYAFVIAIISSLSIPFAPALKQLTTRETARWHHAGEEGAIHALLRWANRFVLVGALIVVIFSGVLSVWLADWLADDRWVMFILGLCALPLLGFNAVRAGVLAGLHRVVHAQLPELLVRPLVLLLAACSLLLLGYLTPMTAIGAFIAAAASSCVLGFLLLKRAFPKKEGGSSLSNRELRSQWLRAWMPFTLLATASTLNTQIAIILLGWLSTDDQVAAMQVAERGAMLVALSLTVVNLVIGPHITQAHCSGDRAKLQHLSRYSARIALIVALPIALPLIFYGGLIIRLVFGGEYAEIATLPLSILAIGQLVNVGFGSVGMLLTMSGYERDTLKGQVIALVFNLFAAIVLIPKLGAVGAALATAISLLIWNGILGVQVFRRLSMMPTAFSLKKG